MEFYRVKENEKKYLKNEKNFEHNTALISSKNDKIVGVLEYEINNMKDAEIVYYESFDSNKECEILKGFIGEIISWNPYVNRILCNESIKMSNYASLECCGFEKQDKWVLHIKNSVSIFKIDINKIIPEQLTVDREKLKRVSSWIDKPEDIIVTCVKIDDDIVTIDGYSRLIAALNKGFDYVYAHFEPDGTNLELYKAGREWCKEEGINSINELAKRVVSSEDHQRLWINRCQDFLKMHK